MTKCDTESESSCSLVKSRRKALSITRQSPSETLSLSSSEESSSESEDGSKKEVEDAITKIAKTTVKQIDTDMSGFASAESSNEGSEDQDPTYVDHPEVTIKNEISGKLTNKERENIRVSNKLKLAKLTSIFTPPKSQKKPPPTPSKVQSVPLSNKRTSRLSSGKKPPKGASRGRVNIKSSLKRRGDPAVSRSATN